MNIDMKPRDLLLAAMLILLAITGGIVAGVCYERYRDRNHFELNIGEDVKVRGWYQERP